MTLVAGVELEVVLVLTVAILAAGFLAVNVCTRKPADPKRDAWLKAYPADAEPPRSRAFRTEGEVAACKRHQAPSTSSVLSAASSLLAVSA